MITLNHTAKNISRVFIFNMGARLINVLYIILIIKKLTEADYAVFTNFQAVWGLVSTFVFTGFNVALTECIARNNGESETSRYKNSILLAQLLIYFVILAVVLIGGRGLSKLLFKSDIYFPAMIFGVVTALGIILNNFTLSIYQGNENFRSFNLLNAGRPMFILLPVIFFAFINKLSFRTAAFSYLWGNLIYGLIIAYIAYLKKGKGQKLSFSLKPAFETIKNLKFLLIYFIVLSIIQQIDVLILSRYANSYELSNYGVSSRYFSMLVLLIGSINVVLLPYVSKKNSEGTRLFLLTWVKKSLWILLLLPFYPLCKGIFLFINGAEYTYAFKILFIHSITFIIGVILSPSINILVTNRKHKQLAALATLSLVVSMVGNVLVLKRSSYGAEGVAVITLISNLIINGGAFLITFFSKSDEYNEICQRELDSYC